MKIYVKYDARKPNLPVAIADSKKELAQKLGVSFHSVLSAYYHKRSTFAEVDLSKVDELEILNIRLYPDNDGGLWYRHPVTRETIYVRD